jgi:tetratricopeptide (TPR) repeat protein
MPRALFGLRFVARGFSRAFFLTAAWLVVLVGPSVSGARLQAETVPYTELVIMYASGQTGTAVARLGELSEARLRAGIDVMAHDFNPQRIEAAIMLHTEYATLKEVSAQKARAHLELVQPLVRTLSKPSIADGGVSTFLSSWYVVAVSTWLVRGDVDAAHRAVTRAVAAFPSDSTLRFWQGYVEEIRNDLRGAESAYRLAIVHDAGNVEARLRLGWVLHLEGQDAAARAELDAVTGATKEPILLYFAHLFLGKVNEHDHDLPGAARHYEAALTICPSCQTAYMALSLIEDRLGHPAKAREVAARFAELSQGRTAEDPWWHYRALGINVVALAWLRNAVR